MIEILRNCFEQYGYIRVDEIKVDNIEFYKSSDSAIASYFLVTSIDCTSFEEDGDAMKAALSRLEAEYITSNTDADNSISIKEQMLKTFNNSTEASQIDKNTSAIYVLKFQNIKNLDKHRNLVYAIEESPNYFLRYVLPYTQEQVDVLSKDLDSVEGKPLNEALSDIANNKEEYYKLMNNRNSGSSYELAIRIFSKVPFLQYNFSTCVTPRAMIEDALEVIKEQDVVRYHEAVLLRVDSIDELLKLEIVDINDQELEKQINDLLGGEKNGL